MVGVFLTMVADSGIFNFELDLLTVLVLFYGSLSCWLKIGYKKHFLFVKKFHGFRV